MKATISSTILIAVFALAGCSSVTSSQQALPPAQPQGASSNRVAPSVKGGALTELYNLDYSNGTITVFSIQGRKATQTAQITPSAGGFQGLAADAHKHIYSTLTESGSSPCAACVQIFTDTGKLVRQLDAPTLPSGSGSPSLTDISVDAKDNVYVSDFGQDAVYFFPRARMTKGGPRIVVQNYHNAASVSSQADGKNVLVSGGCGFASVAPFTRVSRGKYTQGSCFGIGTIALIGGAVDNAEEVMTPVDGVPGLVSVSSPSGGSSFTVPDRLGSISGVAFNSDASIAYVADAHNEYVYAFARPAKSWLSKSSPKLLETYKGFTNLDIIAVPQ